MSLADPPPMEPIPEESTVDGATTVDYGAASSNERVGDPTDLVDSVDIQGAVIRFDDRLLNAVAALSLAQPPHGWTARFEPYQLLVFFQHDICEWRKYPDAEQLIPLGDDWYCSECHWPLLWGATTCWWCTQPPISANDPHEEDEVCNLGGS